MKLRGSDFLKLSALALLALLVLPLVACEQTAAGTAVVSDDVGPEIFLYPGSEADVSAYDICRHLRNVSSDVMVPFAVTLAAWREPHHAIKHNGAVVVEVKPCR